MASSKNNEQLTTPEPLGVTISDVLQEQMLEETENMQQATISNAQGGVNDFDNLILRDIIDNSTVTSVDNICAPSEPSLAATATSVIEAFDVLENGLSSVCNQDSTSIGINTSEIRTNDNNAIASQSPTPIGQLQAQSSSMTDDNTNMQSKSGRHIMISYHHESSFDTCRRICTRLRDRGYTVWMDTNNLHGSIHQGMAEAVENSKVVLFCMNHHYYESEYCKKEALYTDKKHINFIPCLLEKAYEPEGWLGIIIGDQLYIDFSSLNNFDAVFEELIAEIQAIEDRLQISPLQTMSSTLSDNTQSTVLMSTSNMDTSVNNRIQYDSLTAVIRDFRESINQSHHDAERMTEEEFSQFVNYIRRRVFTDTSPLPQTENNNSREILEQILEHSRNQTEFLRRITDILSNITETRTVIKLSLAFVFVWTINKFLKNK